LWNELDLGEYLTLEINNIGSAEDRKSYGAALTSFLEERAESLDDDARKRMHTNPMRVLDSKNPDVQSALGDAPALEDYVNEQSIEHFSKLKALLDRVGITYVVNPRLVRGLDYYNNCVFEWITDSLGAQGTVCGGGRYDGLVAQLGGKPTKAAGFAIGEERLVLMLDSLSKVPAQSLQKTDVYIVVIGEEMSAAAMELSLQLRSSYPQLGIISHCGGGKYNSQLKRAFSSGAELAVVLESDSGEETVKLRRLDDSADSVSVNISEAVLKVGEILGISGS